MSILNIRIFTQKLQRYSVSKVSAIAIAIVSLKSIADTDSDTQKVSPILAIAIIDINNPAELTANVYVQVSSA